jgi:hypothetical protein
MNYVNITATTPQELQVNVNLDGTLAETAVISWVITKEGNDDSLGSIDTPVGDSLVTDNGYYQTLTLDLYGEGLSELMQDEAQYSIEGVSNGVTVYRGQLVTTAQELSSYSVNNDEYDSYSVSNNFTILD